MKNLNSYKKIAKEFIKEAAWDRKFGEPLPTLEDVMNEDPRGVDNIKLEKDDDGAGRINMDDPVMQKTGWSKDNPDLTVGGVLKQGEKHPEYKAAKAIVDKEKGRDSGEDDAGKLSGKSDFSRDGGDEPNPIGDKGDVPIGQLPDPSTRQGDPEVNKAYQAKKAAKAKAAEKPKAEPKGGDSESENLSKVQSVDGIEDIEDLKSDFDFDQKFDAIKDEDSGYKDEYDSDMTIDDLDFKVKMINSGESPKDFLGSFKDEQELADAWKDSTAKAMASKKESIKVINGKKYKAIKESKEPTKSTIHPFKKTYKRIGGK
jgi:hypothetical protein